MIRTVHFMALMTISVLIASCKSLPGSQPLDQTVRETLILVKGEVLLAINQTNEKMMYNEVDAHVGTEIIDSLT